MRYIPEARIEARAAEIWQRHGLTPGFDVERLLDELGLGLVWEQVADETGSMSSSASSSPASSSSCSTSTTSTSWRKIEARLRRYTIGHEIGHWEFHADDVRAGMLSLLDGDRIWCRTGSADPAERQAEMFSASLLMPRDELRAALPQHPWRGWRQVTGSPTPSSSTSPQ